MKCRDCLFTLDQCVHLLCAKAKKAGIAEGSWDTGFLGLLLSFLVHTDHWGNQGCLVIRATLSLGVFSYFAKTLGVEGMNLLITKYSYERSLNEKCVPVRQD